MINISYDNMLMNIKDIYLATFSRPQKVYMYLMLAIRLICGTCCNARQHVLEVDCDWWSVEDEIRYR